MQMNLSVVPDDAHVHLPSVQIDAAVKSVLLGVEPHHGPPWLRVPEPAPRATARFGQRAQSTFGTGASHQGGHDEYPCAAANPAGASRLQSVRPVRRVAELGSLALKTRNTIGASRGRRRRAWSLGRRRNATPTTAHRRFT